MCKNNDLERERDRHYQGVQVKAHGWVAKGGVFHMMLQALPVE